MRCHCGGKLCEYRMISYLRWVCDKCYHVYRLVEVFGVSNSAVKGA
jgi:hypothetical protein